MVFKGGVRGFFRLEANWSCRLADRPGGTVAAVKQFLTRDDSSLCGIRYSVRISLQLPRKEVSKFLELRIVEDVDGDKHDLPWPGAA